MDHDLGIFYPSIMYPMTRPSVDRPGIEAETTDTGGLADVPVGAAAGACRSLSCIPRIGVAWLDPAPGCTGFPTWSGAGVQRRQILRIVGEYSAIACRE